METDEQRKRRWAKIAELKKLEKLQRERRFRMNGKRKQSDNISYGSSTSSSAESDNEYEEKQRYKRISEMKRLEKQQRLQRLANKQKQTQVLNAALRQQQNHNHNQFLHLNNNNNQNNNINTNNNTDLRPKMALAVPQRISLYFNAPLLPNAKKDHKPPQKLGIIKKENAIQFNCIQSMPNAAKSDPNQAQKPMPPHVKYWSLNKQNNLSFINALTPAQSMTVKAKYTPFDISNEYHHNRTKTEPIALAQTNHNNNFTKLNESHHATNNNTQTQHISTQDMAAYNKHNLIRTYSKDDNVLYNNHCVAYNKHNISTSDAEYEEETEDSSSASEIPELPSNIGPPPQHKINQIIDFTDIGMRTITVNTDSMDMLHNIDTSDEDMPEMNDDVQSMNDVANALNDIKIDRYGFRVKDSNNTEANAFDEKKKRLILRKESLLLQQWQSILFPANKRNKMNWDNINKKNSSDRKKIKDLLKKGAIPQPFRSFVWSNLCGMDGVKNKAENDGLYERLLSNQCNKDNEYEEIIWKDIYRTFRDNIKYEAKENDKNKATQSQQSLYNVLAVFSSYNEDIGYCQGMQAISALLLMYMDEEEVFFTLNTIAKSCKYGNLAFCWNMKEIHLRFNQFELCFKEYLPKLYKHMSKNNITNVSMFGATSWFITVFISSNKIDFDLIVRIWDIYLFKGIKIVFQIGIAYLSYFEKQLLKTNSFEILITTLNNGFKIVQENKHNNKLIQSALNIKIKRKQLDKWAQKYQQM